jgi:hypothetical protein
LDIQGQDGRDSVLVDLNSGAGRHTGFVTVANRQSFTDLTIDDSADATARDVEVNNFFRTTDPNFITVAGFTSTGEIDYRALDMSTVTVNAGRVGNTFTIDDAARAATGYRLVLNTGTGSDFVRVLANLDPTTINGQNGSDIVNVSSDFFPAGNLQAIRGDITVTNQFAFSQLTLNGAADTNGHFVTIDMPSSDRVRVNGLAPANNFYNPADVSRVNINGGDRGDTFLINAVAGGPVQINALGGDDIFSVGSLTHLLDRINAPLTLNGNSGFDILSINDQSSQLVHIDNLTASTFTRSFNGPTVTINFSPFESLQINKGPYVSSPPLARHLKLSSSVATGRPTSLTGRLDDADGDKNLTLTVDWGDGSAPMAIKPGRKRFHLNHKYAGAGTYTVRAIWTDGTGESNFRDLQLAVASARRRR